MWVKLRQKLRYSTCEVYKIQEKYRDNSLIFWQQHKKSLMVIKVQIKSIPLHQMIQHLQWGLQSENKKKLFSHRAHGEESISEEITRPQRVYLATCNLTSVVLTARKRLDTTFPHVQLQMKPITWLFTFWCTKCYKTTDLTTSFPSASLKL